MYPALADIVVLIHLFWILFLITGVYWGRRYPAAGIVHLTGLGFAVVSQVFGWYCPLTLLELWLREHQVQAASYPGSFIAYYTEKLVYIRLSPAAVGMLTAALVGLTVWIYMRTYRKTVFAA